MTLALEVTGLSKNFDALKVTDNVELSLPQGARTALIGPNGAGKTTLVNLITGALKPSSGSIHLLGTDITQLSQARRARQGLTRTFQISRLFKPLTVVENVRLAVIQRDEASQRMVMSRKLATQLDEDVHNALAALGLEDRADRKVSELAYGEQRLVELSLALAAKPRVLLLDEPAAGVPQSESHVIMQAIADLPSDLAILFIEHDMDLVFRFAREIVVLVSGAILTTGSPDAVAADARVKEIYFGEAGL